MPNNDGWSQKWPTEPGWYWYFGWISRMDRIDSAGPRLGMVCIHNNSLGQPVYIHDGNFLYKEEGATGVWIRAITPTLPATYKDQT